MSDVNLDPVKLQTELVRLMSRIVITVESNTKRETRVLTGNLRRSWTHEVQASGERGIVGTNVTYAPYQKNKPLTAGLDASSDEITALLKAAGINYFSTVQR
jgi:hypothetical protein